MTETWLERCRNARLADSETLRLRYLAGRRCTFLCVGQSALACVSAAPPARQFDQSTTRICTSCTISAGASACVPPSVRLHLQPVHLIRRVPYGGIGGRRDQEGRGTRGRDAPDGSADGEFAEGGGRPSGRPAVCRARGGAAVGRRAAPRAASEEQRRSYHLRTCGARRSRAGGA